MWKYNSRKRPPFAETPGLGQESVWDYPRPPKLVGDQRRVVVRCGDSIIADSTSTYRVLETAGPPTFYVPPQDARVDLLQPFPGASICEWKGRAKYWGLTTSEEAREAIAWSYPAAQSPYEIISGYLSFYPGRSSVTSITNAFARSPVISTVVGSPTKSPVLGKARRARRVGSVQTLIDK